MAKLREFTGHEPVIRGKKYRFDDASHLKSEASKRAKELRQKGYSVRVKPFVGGYAVFKHK